MIFHTTSSQHELIGFLSHSSIIQQNDISIKCSHREELCHPLTDLVDTIASDIEKTIT